MHTGVDESSLGAFLAAFFEEQAPMVQSDDSADVNRARDARTAPRHANRFYSKFVIQHNGRQISAIRPQTW